VKLPTITRFQKQNYPGSADWFTRFMQDINSFTEIVWNTLNKNITIGDNLDAQVYTFTVIAGADATKNTLSFASTLKHSPLAVLVAGVTDKTAYSTALLNAVGLQWTFASPTITITGIAGLVNTHTYQMTVIVL